MKPGRQNIILEVISEQEIETQNQLIDALAAKGVKSTQATLSRDIKDLRLVKELGPSGRYRYTQARKTETENSGDRLRKIFKESVISYAVAQNLLVVKTLPGLANAAGSAIDNIDDDCIVGTIAGDDTMFIALKTTEAAETLYHRIEMIFD